MQAPAHHRRITRRTFTGTLAAALAGTAAGVRVAAQSGAQWAGGPWQLRGSGIKVRALPGDLEQVVAELTGGDPVTLTGNAWFVNDHLWREVQLGTGQAGWVKWEFFQEGSPTLDGAIESEPVAGQPAPAPEPAPAEPAPAEDQAAAEKAARKAQRQAEKEAAAQAEAAAPAPAEPVPAEPTPVPAEPTPDPAAAAADTANQDYLDAAWTIIDDMMTSNEQFTKLMEKQKLDSEEWKAKVVTELDFWTTSYSNAQQLLAPADFTEGNASLLEALRVYTEAGASVAAALDSGKQKQLDDAIAAVEAARLLLDDADIMITAKATELGLA